MAKPRKSGHAAFHANRAPMVAARDARILELHAQGVDSFRIGLAVSLSNGRVITILRQHGVARLTPGPHRQVPKSLDGLDTPPPLRHVVIDLAEVFDEVIAPTLQPYLDAKRGRNRHA